MKFRHFSNKIVCATLFLSLLVLLGAGESSVAASLPRDGGYLKFGAGFSPYARTSLDMTEISSVSSGLAPSVVFGLVWDRKHSIDVRWQSVYLSDSKDKSQGYLSMTYTHYLRKRGPAPFFDIGFGIHHGPLIGSDLGEKFETNDGLGFSVGAGLRFSRKFEVAIDIAAGSTGRFFTANNNFDFSHRQLAFSMRYTVLGG